jgi:hypothetical protein
MPRTLWPPARSLWWALAALAFVAILLLPVLASAQAGPSWQKSLTQPLTGSLAATGDTSATPFYPAAGRPLNLELTGTWTGTVVLKRKLPSESTWKALTINGTAWGSWTANASEQAWQEGETGAAFELDFTRSSGTLNYRLSQ